MRVFADNFIFQKESSQLVSLMNEHLQKKEHEMTTPKTPEILKEVQYGGQHYKGMAIQPAVYCQLNDLKCCESEAIIYLSRFRKKNGAEDIKKAIHFCQMILEMEYETPSQLILSEYGETNCNENEVEVSPKFLDRMSDTIEEALQDYQQASNRLTRIVEERLPKGQIVRLIKSLYGIVSGHSNPPAKIAVELYSGMEWVSPDEVELARLEDAPEWIKGRVR